MRCPTQPNGPCSREIGQLEAAPNVYVDAGVSGSSQRGRLALAQLLAAAEAKSFDRVVFWKLDRLSRSLRDVLELSDRLEKQGVQIVSIQEGIDAGTATGRMYRNILGTMAEFERETITERIKHGLAEKARQGELLGPVPLGYVRAEDGEIRIDAANGELVRQAFERYATGRYSLRDMAAWSREVGFKSKNGKPHDRMAVGKILRNVSYTGVVAHHRRQGGGVVAEAAHPAIVDADLFDRVSQTLTVRSRDTSANPRPFGRSPYPLSATATCGVCGAPLSGGTGGKGIRYMRCSTSARNRKLACHQRMVAADLLEAQIGAYVSGMQVKAADVEALTAQIARQQAVDPSASKRLPTRSCRNPRRCPSGINSTSWGCFRCLALSSRLNSTRRSRERTRRVVVLTAYFAGSAISVIAALGPRARTGDMAHRISRAPHDLARCFPKDLLIVCY